ncbi:MAG: ATP-binding protein [Bacteroidales bacterium]|jgi:predicted AAA+ superfamily ATPase|nr:ATP-binding protein [Bacteroidales bacterium]
MLLKQDIELAIVAQQEQLTTKSGTINRKFLDDFKVVGNHIEVISGVRRCGKSTLMKKIIQSLYQKTAWFNFEDSRVHGFEVNDFSKLDELMGGGIEAYFFDEIQNVPSWEIFVRQLHDRNDKVYVTGSNAALLSKELGTRLTGRHIRHELFPFNYTEFLNYRNYEPNPSSFNHYIQLGGFPEYLDTETPEILQNLLKDIVFRDIAVRYGIRNTGSLMDMTLYLISNIGKEFSYNTLRKTFSIGSANTVSDYLTWLGDSYLLFFLPRFSWSAKSIAMNPRKVFSIDTGLVNANTLSFSKDRGRLIENAVYLFLRQHRTDLYYFRENHECDFVVFKGRECKMLIQVCEQLNHDNLKRETQGLEEAMNFFGLKEGYILTLDQFDELRIQNNHVHILPVYQFFISDLLD